MAEGGAEEVAEAHKTITEKMCGICLEENSFKQASWYCKQCSQRLCDKCTKYHRKVSTTKSHQIIQADDMSPIISSEQTERLGVSDVYRAPLCPTHNRQLEVYCEDHNVPVCDSCKLVDHRKCQNHQDLQQAVTKHKGKCQDVVQHLRAIDNGMEEIREAMKKEKDTIETNKTAAIQKIRQEMKRIEILGQEKILEVEEIFKEENKAHKKETEVMKQSKALVTNSIDELEKSSKAGSEEDLFLATRDAEIQAEKYQGILNESSFLTHSEIQFEVNSKLEEIGSVGHINLEKSTVSVEQKPQVIDYLNIDCKQMIMWIDMFPNDQLALLTFCENAKEMSQLRLYSASKCFLSQLNLPPAFSAAKINAHQIVVAISIKGQLKIVNTDNNKLVKQSVFKTKGCPGLVSEYSNQSVLILEQQEKDKFHFQLLDLRGRVLKQSAVLTNLELLFFMRTSQDRQAVYITDVRTGIFGFNLQGDTIFHFRQHSYKGYVGLSLDKNNNLYCAVDSKSGERVLIKMNILEKNVKPIALVSVPCQPLKYAAGKLYLCKINDKNKFNIVYLYF